ncbi:MAG: hypothetical protein ACI4S3_10620 [Candidatus Gastranaerophilaceae bacterium]
MNTEETYSAIEEQEEHTDLYPKFELTDKDGQPIRDARFYPFVSRVISSANREIASHYKYQHFE